MPVLVLIKKRVSSRLTGPETAYVNSKCLIQNCARRKRPVSFAAEIQRLAQIRE